MKLYTRSGDDGSTGLFGGGRVSKCHPRVEAYGTVDELNACIGLTCAALPKVDPSKLGRGESPSRVAPERQLMELAEMLTSIQSRLFDLGADLATPDDSPHQSKIRRLEQEHITEIEGWIDQIDSANQPLTNFVLPGGSEAAARLHLARTVCRRAERLLVSLSQAEAVNPHALVYLNRLSDLLFAMARAANRLTGHADVTWQ